jgi:hypothetical protein
MELNIVTGANQNYYNFLNTLLENINETISLTNIHFNVYVYDLGLDLESSNILKETYPNFIYKTFDYSKYPIFFDINIRKGEYAWKSACIKEVYNHILSNKKNNHGILLWMDSANLFTEYDKIIDLMNIIKKQGIYSPISDGSIEKWTHKKSLEFFDNYYKNNFIKDILSLPMRTGGVIGIDLDNVSTHKFIEKFYNCCSIKHCISPEGSHTLNHRQDQSILSILYYEYTNKNLLEENYISFKTHHNRDGNGELILKLKKNDTESIDLKDCTLESWQTIIKSPEHLIIHSVDPDDPDDFTLTPFGMNFNFTSLINKKDDIIQYQVGEHLNTVLCCLDIDKLNKEYTKHLNNTLRTSKINITPTEILQNLEKNGIKNHVLSIEDYYKELPNHKFVICPVFDNIDSHLYYEAIAAGCIPIVLSQKNSFMIVQKYNRIPILFTENYTEINEENLNKIYHLLLNNSYDYSKILLFTLDDEDRKESLIRSEKWFNSLNV